MLAAIFGLCMGVLLQDTVFNLTSLFPRAKSPP